jgi:polyisoprenyl-teichoic acid--peptidoglycan teichoic acid transferase
LKTIRRVVQIAVCFLILHSCADDWTKDLTKNDSEIKSESTNKSEIVKTDNNENAEQQEGLNLFTKKEEPLNVLIIGSDQRGNEASRADTIMVAQYDAGSKKAKIMSIMRDSYVFIPGHGMSKINHAFSWGGEALLQKTIEENFKVKTDRVVKIDFQGFVGFIDHVLPQGVEVDVPAEMINHWKWDMEPGKHVLHGQQLLNYVRFRKDSESDFGRVRRQQEVLGKVQKAVMEKLTNGEGIQTVSSLMKEGKKAIETDLELGDLLSLGMSSMLNPIDSFDSIRIPVEDSFKNVMTHDAGLVLELDAQANAEAAEKFFRP